MHHPTTLLIAAAVLVTSSVAINKLMVLESANAAPAEAVKVAKNASVVSLVLSIPVVLYSGYKLLAENKNLVF